MSNRFGPLDEEIDPLTEEIDPLTEEIDPLTKEIATLTEEIDTSKPYTSWADWPSSDDEGQDDTQKSEQNVRHGTQKTEQNKTLQVQYHEGRVKTWITKHVHENGKLRFLDNTTIMNGERFPIDSLQWLYVDFAMDVQQLIVFLWDYSSKIKNKKLCR
jgi:hypothetical protein